MAEYEAYKDAEIGKVGSIPVHWETIRIGNLFKEVSDRYETGMTEDLPLLSVSEYYGVAKRSDKIADDSILVRADSLDGYKICRPGDIVSNIMLTWKGALGSSPYAGIVSPAYCVYRPNGTINSRYFHYLFRTKAYTDVFHVNSTGLIDSRLRLYTPKFFALFAPVPPMEEQNVIVEYLDKITKRIDAIISEAKASIEEYKAWKASIIFEAVTKGLDPNVEMKESGIEWIGKTPANWNVTKLKLFIDILPGYAFSSDDFASDGVPLLRGINVSPNRIRWDDVVHWNKPIDGYLQPFLLQEKDLVVGLDRPWINTGTRIAFVKRNDLPALLLQRVCRIRTLGDLDIRLVKYWLESSSFRESLSTETTGVSVPHISTKQIQEFKIAVPSMSEQYEICEYLERICAKIDGLISEKESLLEDLESYKKSLIFEVVTGKRKVV